ncbi:CHAD domain-containing protein [Segetibacter koreensis]|uniref:CHAD domain-containing protein n=1 Tax=Segetibacter koreensis TaxID=398037 RepID=UPI000366F147|nr:CHAD domain-containing protein [Segetibacter koreensis]
MAKTKKIQKFLNLQWDEMRNNLDNLCISWNGEKLHNLRLNAKKTKAVVSLLKNCSSKKRKFSIKKLKELFDHAGEIRTAQLNVEALHENNIQNENLEKEQNVIIERESDELCKRKKTYSRNIKKLKKSISLRSVKIKNRRIKSYYQESLEQLKGNFLPPIKEDLWHESRKIIKRLLFALTALPKNLQQEINFDKKYFDELQDKIGKWHDTIIALNMLPANDPGYQLLDNKKQMQLEELVTLTNSINEKAVS